MTTLEQLHRRLRKGLKLSKGERLIVHRRSLGYTQREMADAMAIGVDKLRLWEQDFEECPRTVAQVSLKDLPISELLRIHRQRLNLRIAYIARIMKKSVGWVHRAHTGVHEESTERLANFLLTKGKGRR